MNALFGLTCISSAVPGPVQGLKLAFVEDTEEYSESTNTYFLETTITWDLPATPNGVITGYQYSFRGTNDTGADMFSGNTSETSITVNTTVVPYTNYTVMVQASTSAGFGDEAIDSAFSPEAGMPMLYK